jgi:hypothetical protein
MDTLPTELVFRIVHYVNIQDRHDLLSLRRVCKSLRDITCKTFNTSFFETLTFDISSQSLGLLTETLQHPTFGPFVKHLVLDTRRPAADASPQNCDGQLRSTTASMLRTAFSALPNNRLESLTIENTDDEAALKKGETERWLDNWGPYTSFFSRTANVIKITPIVVKALKRAKIDLNRFSAIRSQDQERSGHALCARGLLGPSEQLPLSGVYSAFASLTQLDLHIFPTCQLGHFGNDGVREAIAMAQCINSATQLKSLHLELEKEGLTNDEAIHHFPNQLFRDVNVETIENLVVKSWTWLEREVLTDFLHRHSRVHRLTLTEMCMSEENSGGLSPIQAWCEILKPLAQPSPLVEFSWRYLIAEPTWYDGHYLVCDIESCSKNCCDEEKAPESGDSREWNYLRTVKGDNGDVVRAVSRMLANFASGL